MVSEHKAGDSALIVRTEIALCAAAAMLLLWKGLIPAWRVLNTDFPNYYLVARLFHEGFSLDRIYDWVWLQRIKDHWGLDQPLVGFAGLTPLSALPIVPLAIFSALTAKRIWIIVNLAFLATSAELMQRSTSLGRRRIWLITLLAVLPLRTSFLYGQMHLLVLLLMALAYFFYRRDRVALCGLCIALAGALKVYPLIFVGFFMWKRQWRMVLATAGATLAVFIIGGLVMGWEPLRVYAFEMLPRSLQGETLDPYSLRAGSGAALFHRLFLFEPALNPTPAFSSPTLYAVLYPLWQVTILFPLFALLRPGEGDREREQVEWAGFLFALLLLSPVPSTYHFVVMILCVVLFEDVLLRQNRRWLAIAVALLYFLISQSGLIALPAHAGIALNTFLAFSRLWFGTVLFVIFLACLYRLRLGKSMRFTDARFALLCFFTLVAVASSVAMNRRHFIHRDDEMQRSVAPPAVTLLATMPWSRSDARIFVAMTPEGYGVSDAEGHSVLPDSRLYSRRSADQLSFAVAPDRSLLVELADASGSRIVRGPGRSLLVEDAESPAISFDGRQVAFIRENKGLGSLWTLYTSSSNDGPAPSPMRITDESYDVREASFLRTGGFLFLAKVKGRAALFRMMPGTLPVMFFAPDVEIGSFAVSEDGHRIALTERIHNRWQLAVLNVDSRRTTVLTEADCNAYTPSWSAATSIVYATDCGRGVGLTALHSFDLSAAQL